MSQSELKLRVLFDAVDRISKPLKTMLQGNRQLTQSFKATHDKLKALNRAQKELASFRALRAGMRQTADALKTAQQRVQALSERIKASDAPTAAMTRKFSQASLAVTQLSQHFQAQGTQLKVLQSRLTATGIQTGRLGESERRLRSDINATNAALSAQKAQLAAVASQEKHLMLARERMHRLQSKAASLSVAGYATRTTGLRTLSKIDHTLGEAKAVQLEQQRIRALGLGEATSNEAIEFAQQIKTIGTSQAENLTLMRDALSVFADLPHAKLVLPTLAKMKFANEALYGSEDAAANEERFINMLKVIELRGGLASETRFKEEAERIQKVFTATGGRVGPEQWQGFIQTGGVAAKQLRSDAFYYQMEPLIQEMGGEGVGHGLMSAYNNLYQGKTTLKAATELQRLGLVDPEKIVFEKGKFKKFGPGAIKGAKLFKESPLEWIEQVFLPALAEQNITDPDQIKDIIAMIVSDRTAANLLTTLYLQRAQIHKSTKLSAGAADIDTLYDSAQQIARGREIQFLTKLHDLKRALGEQVLPLYSRALDVATRAIQRLTAWVEQHPKTTQFLVTTLTVLGGLLAGFGTLMIALAAILGPLAIVNFSLASLGINGGIASGVLTSLGRIVPWVLRLLAEFPVVAAIIGTVLAALYAWQHWDTIGPMLSNAWAKLTDLNVLATSAMPISLGELSALPPVESREPMKTRPAKQFHVEGDSVNITIQGLPGMDATAIAQAVRREMDKLERDKMARFASRLVD